ncbi:hypothetical protein GYMLUDRAFT_1028488 [Collybiopsis luxurians FD-317 M1]|uniref:Uncharacterized protein n=1 Tax=Collybiopsis luxurians FD-317 M1 TaxID=944289 RepID=A0A0D0BDU0_9AGAR|nr:hypothetical protein GYMLUDRAFT_1028488 [Collybiopsis luxurians FD-317 M1]
MSLSVPSQLLLEPPPFLQFGYTGENRKISVDEKELISFFAIPSLTLTDFHAGIDADIDVRGKSSLKPSEEVPNQDRLQVSSTLDFSIPTVSKQIVSENFITMAQTTAARKGYHLEESAKLHAYKLQLLGVQFAEWREENSRVQCPRSRKVRRFDCNNGGVS